MISPSAQAERAITLYSKGQPALILEGVLHVPATVEQAPIVILCHPQPASSDMQDNLTVALAHGLTAAGMVTIRFNFRGVGKSQGQQTEGGSQSEANCASSKETSSVYDQGLAPDE